MKKIGIIGCGAIGTLVAKAIESRIVKCDQLLLYDYNQERSERLKKSLQSFTSIVESVEKMISAKPAVIVEAASQQAVHEYLPSILAQDIDVIVMSVGALLDMEVTSKRVHISSGAIGGLDAISSAAMAGIHEVTLTTRKNPAILKANNKEESVVFDGEAYTAVKLFPKEMNVAATLALTVKPEKVKVRVISSPQVKKNVHEVHVVWKHGEMTYRFENDPHPENPGTSALAAWSAISLLKELMEQES